MRFRRRGKPMSEDRFWELIAVLGGSTDDQAVARLTQALSARGHDDAVAFHQRLALALYELDREVLADQPVRFTDEPPHSKIIPLSDDSFLYLRAGIVAAGRETYRAVLADPSLLASGAWDECEPLLYVAEEVTGGDIETAVSYETGSNQRYWTPRQEPVREEWDQGPRPVIVRFRDLANYVDAERRFADGRIQPDRFYLPPDYLDDHLGIAFTLILAKAVATNGGLPAGLGTEHVELVVEFGPDWQLEPQVSELFEDDEFDRGMIRRSRVRVPGDVAAAWPADTRHDVLLALAASCLLAVLPDSHAARPEVQELYQRGAAHLPSSRRVNPPSPPSAG